MTDNIIEYSVHKHRSSWMITQAAPNSPMRISHRFKTKRDAVATAEQWRDRWLAKDYQVYLYIFDAKGNFQSQEVMTICRGDN